jgi:hypothetical protein
MFCFEQVLNLLAVRFVIHTAHIPVQCGSWTNEHTGAKTLLQIFENGTMLCCEQFCIGAVLA